MGRRMLMTLTAIMWLTGCSKALQPPDINRPDAAIKEAVEAARPDSQAGSNVDEEAVASDDGIDVEEIEARLGRVDFLPHCASEAFRRAYNEGCDLHKRGKHQAAEAKFMQAFQARGTSRFERMVAAYARAKVSQARGGEVVIPTEFHDNSEVCGNVFVAVTVANHLVRDGHKAVAWGEDDWNVAAQVQGHLYHLTFSSLFGAFMNSGKWLHDSQSTGLFEAAEAARGGSAHAYVLGLFQDVTQHGAPAGFPEARHSTGGPHCANCGTPRSTVWQCRKCNLDFCPDCIIAPTGRPALKEFETERMHMLDTTDDGSRPTCPKCGSNLGNTTGGEATPSPHVEPSQKSDAPRRSWTLQEYAQAIGDCVTNTTPCEDSGMEAQRSLVRTLGEEIDNRWGFEAMQQVWHAVHDAMGPGPCSDLTRIWDGVGRWQK